jgi:hypothetical protein
LENVDWELNPEEIVPRIESFQISVDGEPVDISFSELPNPKGEDKPLLPWASFPLTFPAGQETNLHVSYLLPLQPSVKGNEMALYYIFQTGAGWAGPIGQAELIVNLPYPASIATMAGMRSGGLRLPPYYRPKRQTDLAEAVLEGNQARWMWKDFEPGPQDDFAIWLMDLGKWNEMESARAAVQANPEDGQAWLNLASVYRSVATSGYNQPSLFAESYLSPGIEAYQKAADLLPEHPAPHSGLALLKLVPYTDDKNAPADVIQSVQDELAIARELEAKHPALAEEAGLSSFMVEDALSNYAYNDATATADWVAWSTDWARQTAEGEATLGLPTASPTAPPTATATITPPASRTPEPAATRMPAASPTTAATIMPEGTGFQSGGGMLMCVAGGILILSAAYVVVKMLRRR